MRRRFELSEGIGGLRRGSSVWNRGTGPELYGVGNELMESHLISYIILETAKQRKRQQRRENGGDGSPKWCASGS